MVHHGICLRVFECIDTAFCNCAIIVRCVDAGICVFVFGHARVSVQECDFMLVRRLIDTCFVLMDHCPLFPHCIML